jgi:cell division protease FtsH
LDPALLRPGRFDRRVVLDRPDWLGRRQILDVHMRGKPIAKTANRDTLAKRTIGFVGADLENLVNEAAILAARRNKKEITQAELEEAVEKVQLGPERRSRVVPDEEKKVVAYHEAGHALIGHLLEHADPVQKVTIVPRGMAGGVTWFLPEDDRTVVDSAYLQAQLAVALGGRVAEEIVFGDITTGASADLQSVTNIARSMVTQYGMSKKMGPVTYGEKEELIFLGREISEQRNYSDGTAEEIDAEVKRMVDEAYATAKKILTEYRHKLDEVAQRLLEEETIDAEDFAAIFAVEPPPAITSKFEPLPA